MEIIFDPARGKIKVLFDLVFTVMVCRSKEMIIFLFSF